MQEIRQFVFQSKIIALRAAICENHPHHGRTFRWLEGTQISVCPLSELGFIRISTNPQAIHAPMEKARKLLQNFLTEGAAKRVPDDLLALAEKHGMKLATLDEKIKHPASVRVDRFEKQSRRETS